MRLLLDTHAVLWWWLNNPKLSAPAKSAIEEADTVVVSAVCSWEMATKHRLGKMVEVGPILPIYEAYLTRDGFGTLAVSHDHALRAGGYASAHGDPFDRMLAAQGELENMIVITRDPAFADFPCLTLW